MPNKPNWPERNVRNKPNSASRGTPPFQHSTIPAFQSDADCAKQSQFGPAWTGTGPSHPKDAKQSHSAASDGRGPCLDPIVQNKPSPRLAAWHGHLPPARGQALPVHGSHGQDAPATIPAGGPRDTRAGFW